MLKMGKVVLDLFYPVGTYYETSDTTFDPNVRWGGTWVEDTKGLVTVGLDTSQAEFNVIGKVYGEKTHIITINEMPNHGHGLTYYDPNHIGELGTVDTLKQECFGGFLNTYRTVGSTYFTGNSHAHNNVQPSIVVKRWHRTA